MYTLPDSTLQDAATYKAAIDESAARNFGVYPNDPADMSVNVNAGAIFNGTSTTAYAAQAVGPITAPVTNPRIDRIILNPTTGVASVLAGSESATPSAPAITSGYISLAQITLATSTTAIGYTLIENEQPIQNTNGRYTTATLSPAGDATKDFGRLFRVTLDAVGDKAQIRFRITYANDGNYAEFLVTTRQIDALNSDPDCYIECVEYNNRRSTGGVYSPSVLTTTAVTAFYTISATESYVDVYVSSLNYNDTVLKYQFTFIDLFATATFEAFNAETPIAALSWDVTSVAAPGVIVYDQTLTLDNNFTGGTVRLIATRGIGGYWCQLVAITAITHASSNLRFSSNGLVPASYDPALDTRNAEYSAIGASIIQVNTAGAISMSYVGNDGASRNATGHSTGLPISWFKPD